MGEYKATCELIERIYSAVHHDILWTEMLQELCRRFSSRGVLLLNLEPNTREIFLRARGMHDDCMDRLGHQPAGA